MCMNMVWCSMAVSHSALLLAKRALGLGAERWCAHAWVEAAAPDGAHQLLAMLHVCLALRTARCALRHAISVSTFLVSFNGSGALFLPFCLALTLTERHLSWPHT